VPSDSHSDNASESFTKVRIGAAPAIASLFPGKRQTIRTAVAWYNRILLRIEMSRVVEIDRREHINVLCEQHGIRISQ
jgi:hypothetical protein